MTAEYAPKIESEAKDDGRPRSQELGQRTLKAANQAQERSAKPLPPFLKMADFADVYSERKIRRDERYCEERRGRFFLAAAAELAERGEIERPDKIKKADLFEKLFLRGLRVGHWLGDLPDGDQPAPFTTHSYGAAPYDDISHRVDAFTTLTFRESLETDSGIEIRQLPLGFDVTLKSGKDDVLNKLTKHYNPKVELPFGFSKLDYYTDGRTKGSLALLPRYVIGVADTEVDALNRVMTGQQPDLLAPRVLRARFKVLAEIRAQNELYDAMLPDGAYESDDMRLRQAAAYIEAADTQLNQALSDCADDLLMVKGLPRPILERLEATPPQGAKRRKIIEDYLFEQAHAEHVQKQMANASREGKYYIERDDQSDDPFVQIINQARRLTELAYDDDSELQAHREIGVHNQALTV